MYQAVVTAKPVAFLPIAGEAHVSQG